MFAFTNNESAAPSESYELTDWEVRLQSSQHDSKIERSRVESIANRDAADLARLGKKQVLKVRDKYCWSPRPDGKARRADLKQRNFTFLPILSFACTVIITWEATFL